MPRGNVVNAPCEAGWIDSLIRTLSLNRVQIPLQKASNAVSGSWRYGRVFATPLESCLNELVCLAYD